jgi:DNA-binding response OmpR family regulator
LLIDEDDERRMTQVALLKYGVYSVEVRKDFKAAQSIADEGAFDLIILALRIDADETSSYSNELACHNAGLPILLLTDHGMFALHATVTATMEAGRPMELMSQVARCWVEARMFA